MSGYTDAVVESGISVGLPGKYNVIFHNDDVTPMGFVVELLMKVFDMDKVKAVKAMLAIHKGGHAVVGTYIKSIADTKVSFCREVSEKANYPLQITMEKE